MITTTVTEAHILLQAIIGNGISCEVNYEDSEYSS